jgi:hypothetical protein
MYKAVYISEVKSDFINAKQWYSSQQFGLDIRFETAIKNTIKSISQTPFAYAMKYKNVRIAYTKIFPYNIHFVIEEDLKIVIIIGIVHNRRNDAMNLNRNS